MQDAVGDPHVDVGRDDVDLVGFDAHAFSDLHDGHLAMGSEQFGQKAVVARREMLDDDESETELGGEAFEKLGAGLEPAGGGADAGDHEIGQNFDAVLLQWLWGSRGPVAVVGVTRGGSLWFESLFKSGSRGLLALGFHGL